ncbi:hypothetical protein ARTHRO8AJ_460031 [Arthrobacter sp. 8AJ]|nr:hypothetical protein ARTHRO8AJ_460031 [Arthrobacter sp. 8AJ]
MGEVHNLVSLFDGQACPVGPDYYFWVANRDRHKPVMGEEAGLSTELEHKVVPVRMIQASEREIELPGICHGSTLAQEYASIAHRLHVLYKALFHRPGHAEICSFHSRFGHHGFLRVARLHTAGGVPLPTHQEWERLTASSTIFAPAQMIDMYRGHSVRAGCVPGAHP